MENEIDCLIRCKLYQAERGQLFSKIPLLNKSFNHLNKKSKFIYLLESSQICDQNVYQFVNQCWKNSYSKRNEKTELTQPNNSNREVEMG